MKSYLLESDIGSLIVMDARRYDTHLLVVGNGPALNFGGVTDALGSSRHNGSRRRPGSG